MTLALERPRLIGSTTPRLSTAPLVTGAPGPCGCGCALSPETSLGFEAISFATEVLNVDLLAWQRWWLIHAFELLPSGRYRFRTILTLVARQQGKTTLLKIVALWAMFMGRSKLILGAAQSLDIAREAWQGAVELAKASPELSQEVAGVRYANGEQCLTSADGARYRIAAATRSAGRGLSVDLLILDEIREHRSTDAWGALSKTTLARQNAMIVGISNAGDDESIVLNTLRAAALSATDSSIGLFEWSAPDHCALDDTDAWCQAMPGLGVTIDESAVRSFLATDPVPVFRTELLCQHVSALLAAFDLASWRACADSSETLETYRNLISLCVDVAPDGGHVTLAGAALRPDGRVRVEIMGAWTSIVEADRELTGIVTAIRPLDIGWFPLAPVGALGSTLRGIRRMVRRVMAKVDKVKREVVLEDEHEATKISGSMDREACQGMVDLVNARQLLHPSDPLLDAHVAAAERLITGDGYRFTRSGGSGHVDAAYAAAGAVYLARMAPPPPPLPRPKAF